MAAFDISEIIGLVPSSKLTTSKVCAEESEFDASEALQALLGKPLDFPTLDQAILREDTVCIPVEPGIPDDQKITAQVARAVVDLGVEPSQITILLHEGSSKKRVESFVKVLSELALGDCMVQVHDANEPECLGYLGPSQSGEPITLNARLVHADFVLPIARAKPFGWKGQADFLYPYFSDLESQKRFFKLNERSRLSLNHEVHRWLGNCFLVAVATRVDLKSDGRTGVVGKAILGENDAVKRAAQSYLESCSSGGRQSDEAKPRHDLVIANLNPFLCLTKEEIREVLADLKELCSPAGSIVLIWNDDSGIPAWVDRDDEDLEFAGHGELDGGNETTSLDRQESNDTGPRKVFLCCEQPLLQELGISRIDNLKELQKLIDLNETVLVLPDFINDYAYHRPIVENDQSAGAIA